MLVLGSLACSSSAPPTATVVPLARSSAAPPPGEGPPPLPTVEPCEASGALAAVARAAPSGEPTIDERGRVTSIAVEPFTHDAVSGTVTLALDDGRSFDFGLMASTGRVPFSVGETVRVRIAEQPAPVGRSSVVYDADGALLLGHSESGPSDEWAPGFTFVLGDELGGGLSSTAYHAIVIRFRGAEAELGLDPKDCVVFRTPHASFLVNASARSRGGELDYFEYMVERLRE